MSTTYVEGGGQEPAEVLAAAEAANDAPPTKRSLRDKLFYGLGSVAFGVKDNGFTVLLMIFYNQALGVSAAAVGVAIMVALIVDAVCDPLIGNWSDNFRSRLGRRHPFMYAAALPIAVSYFFLWNPPGWLTVDDLFWYLMLLSIFIRLCISLYEIPSAALVVDLAQDYDDRTSLLSYRYFFGWVGGLTISVLGFSVFLRPSAEYPTGTLNLDGYSLYGLTASLMMFAAIIASSLGTQRLVAQFPAVPERQPFVFARSAREIWGTLVNRPFLTVAGATLFSFAASGIATACLTYFRIFFWELTGDQISLLLVGNFAAVFVALFAAPRIAAALGKKRAAVTLWIGIILASPAMYWSRLLGLLPPNGSELLYWILFTSSFVNTLMAVCIGVVGSSLLADVVEHTAARTGRHAAGLIFSANAFMLKATSGIGAFGAGMILAYVEFPEGAKVGQVSQDVLIKLGWTEPAVIMGLQIAALGLILGYPITRAIHEANLRKLAANS
ncbi:MFS transporter [Sphingopyxis sp. 113P3]|uniref:MFS transporter n=1 Tax=Sphingopyxis sp. (strain 113P3) TaxID=292913 RepID=UPI0006BDFB2F|nr:MFS transporter [Sphingopyxis sp. 113P3]ALC14676.1 hypothetical protein LH20_22170 [Sphingopyxis sp. 113P3]